MSNLNPSLSDSKAHLLKPCLTPKPILFHLCSVKNEWQTLKQQDKKSLPKSLQRKILFPKSNETTHGEPVLHLERTLPPKPCTLSMCVLFCVYCYTPDKKRDSIRPLEGHILTWRDKFYRSESRLDIYNGLQFPTSVQHTYQKQVRDITLHLENRLLQL